MLVFGRYHYQIKKRSDEQIDCCYVNGQIPQDGLISEIYFFMLFHISSDVIHAELWMRISTLKFPRIFNFPTVADVSPTVVNFPHCCRHFPHCCGHSPSVADISLRLQTFPPLLQTFPPLLQTFPPLLQTFPPLLQTFPSLLRTFPPLLWIFPTVADISPTVADISPTVVDIPPWLQTFRPLLQTFPHCCRHFPHCCGHLPHGCGHFPHGCGHFPHCCGHYPHARTLPLLQTHSLHSLLWDVCKKLKSFHIQSCCMMSMYHIKDYITSITNLNSCNNFTPTVMDRVSPFRGIWPCTCLISLMSR